MEHTCTTCFPTWLLSANQTRSTQSGACQRKKKQPFCWVPRWRSAHVHTALDGFVWASTEASIVRAGGGKHFISKIRRLSEPCDSECRTCLPFTHGCRLSQSRVSGATPATLPTHKVGGRAHIKANMWHQFSFENQSYEQGKLNLKQPWSKQAGLCSNPLHFLFLKSDKACLILASESKNVSGTS